MKKQFLFVLAISLFAFQLSSYAQFNRNHNNNDGNNSNTNTNSSQTDSQPTSKSGSDNEEDMPSKKGFDKRKMIYGGFLYPAYYNGLTLQCSALVGYRFTKRIAAGVSCEYFYSSVSGTLLDPYGNISPNATEVDRALGLGFWGKYLVLQDFHGLDVYGSGILEGNNYKSSFQEPGYTFIGSPTWYTSFLAGAGIRQRMGERFFLNLAIYYDVLQQNPMYQNRVVYRVGFSSGF